MSKPLENYIIRIKSSIDQFDNEGVIREEDRDHIELMTRGSFTKKNGSYYISYKETQTIGFEGCTTTIKIAEDGSRVALPAGRRRRPHRQPQHAGNDGTARQLTSHCFLPAAPAASGLRTQTRKDT